MSTHSTTLQPLDAAALSRYAWRELQQRERDSLLQLLVTAQKPILLFARNGAESAGAWPSRRSLVLEFVPAQQQITINSSGSPTFDRALLQQGAVLLAELDEGMLQLELEEIRREPLPNWQVGLLARLTLRVLLIQRRGVRRVAVSANVHFAAPVLSESGVERVEVEDLSDSGVGLRLHGGAPAIEPGRRLDGQLTLPGRGAVELSLLVRIVQPLVESGGGAGVVLGGEFVGLSASTRALIQRYTFQCELEQRRRLEALHNLQQSQVVVGEPQVQERL
jgi:hypothetical protein